MTTAGTSDRGLTTDDLAARTPDRAESHDDRDPAAAPYPDLDGTPSGATRSGADDDTMPLLDDAAAEPFSRRWSEVQTRFVDDPRAAVRDADALVAELMQALAERFSQHKGGLEDQWNRGDEPDTEQLRLALQQYRSFFDRLLTA